MLKKILLANLFLSLLVVNASAQVLTPATWSWKAGKSNAKVGETVEIVFMASINPGWHVFSSDQDPNVGPLPTIVEFKKNKTFALVGTLRPVGNPIQKKDEIFDGPVRYFQSRAEFRQKVKILGVKPILEGSISGQACTDEDGRCVPLNEDFKIEKLTVVAVAVPETATASTSAAPIAKVEPTPKKIEPVVPVEATPPAPDTTNAAAEAGTPPVMPLIGSLQKPNDSLWGFFLLALAAGFGALLTPCVYPIIPMTVSYFTGQRGSRGKTLAGVYGLSIVAIYVLFGTLVSWLFGASFANFLATHWLPNVLFFLVFVLFGLSFLGWFEIVLPSSLVNKMDAHAEKGGLTGVFFMAFTLVLVSFSCTGPLAGSILIAGAQGQVIKPVIGMLGFSLAFAVPFTLLAVFPEWMKSLPKSGGWLNAVKVVFGFLELAFALKFLSTADQVYHWGILDREVYLALWIVLFALTGFYLLGKIQTPHDSKIERISVPRLVLAIVTFAFVVYLVPGMFGAPLRALAGYLPPETSFDPFIGGGLSPVAAQPAQLNGKAPRFADKFKLPHQLQGFFDYKEALAYSRQVDKPLFIDFTGHGCVNCREMEARVWSEPQVLQRLRNDFVVVALYVDDKTELPEAEHYVSKVDGKTKRTIGAQNLDFQISRFGSNAQPHYCLVDSNGNLLGQPRAYNLDSEVFTQFLDRGKLAFQGKPNGLATALADGR
ncbi:MAG: thioredoxin family protein [Cytophagaceae bacterium]|nr:thioredoxin family protein [Cytophagaceae bacterium]